MKVYICPVPHCNAAFITLHPLIRHLKYTHETVQPFSCDIDGCICIVKNGLAYERHCRTHHTSHYKRVVHGFPDNESVTDIAHLSAQPNSADVPNSSNSNQPTTDSASISQAVPSATNNTDCVDSDSDDSDNDLSESDSEIDELDNGDGSNETFESQVAGFLVTGREKHRLSTSATQFVSASSFDLLNQHSKFLLSKVQNYFKPDLTEVDKRSIDDIFFNSPLRRSYEKFSHEKSLDRFVSASPFYVPPVEYLLGRTSKGKKETFQYIPVEGTLSRLLSHDDVLAELSQVYPSQDGFIRNFKDGIFFKSHSFFSSDEEDRIMLNVYDDEFVVSNPLGNKTRKCKVTAFYFTIANFSAQINSKVQNIFLLCLVLHKHIKKYGIQPIMDPVIQDISRLETTGLVVKEGKFNLSFHAAVFIVISDNLAAHWLGGFQESFSTTKRVCRVCMCTRSQMKTITHHKDCHLRNEESYDMQVAAVKINPALQKEYGVKDECPLNALSHFHCITGIPFDAAHDFMEGVLPYILSELVKTFVSASYFTLEDVNDVVDNFEYSRVDKNDIPQQFTISGTLSEFKVKLTAGECLVFARLFPLMFGSFVPEFDTHWDLLLLLLDYLQLLMAFEFYPGTTERMDDIFEMILVKIREVLPHFQLKPKFHFALHYGMQTRHYGPPRIRYTLRYESKHLALKQPLQLSKNRKNICLTLAHRNQAQLYQRYRRKNFFDEEHFMPIGLRLIHPKVLHFSQQQLLLPLIGNSLIVETSHGIKLSSGSFYSDDIVLYSDDHRNYVFIRVDRVVYIKEEAYVFCNEIDILSYSVHHHAYSIEISQRYQLLEVTKLHTNNVLGMYDLDGTVYVPLKFEVMNIF